MLKIKDNEIVKGYKGFWVNNDEKYIDETHLTLSNEFDKFDIVYEIDEILKSEGYKIDFHNCCMRGYDEVIYYEFGEKYSIELYEVKKDKEFLLTFVLKQFETFKDLWELEYLRNLFENIIWRLKRILVEKVDEQ